MISKEKGRFYSPRKFLPSFHRFGLFRGLADFTTKVVKFKTFPNWDKRTFCLSALRPRLPFSGACKSTTHNDIQ